ncbi:MAG TPA: NepR family anti-sigma factor [Hyphomicrobium sp.]|nr:NepR family anti-sigma factor [Hyphomicrobium sp.]
MSADNDKRQDTPMTPDDLSANTENNMAKIDGALPRELQGAIGKQLKHVYGQMLAEPLPDKFTQLLESLSKTDGNS